MDGGAWWAAVHGVTRSQRQLSDFTFTFHFHALEKEMAAHSSVLAWRIPGTGEPGGLPSMGSHRVRHDWSDSAVAARYGSGHAGYSQKHCHSKEVLKFLSLLLKAFHQPAPASRLPYVWQLLMSTPHRKLVCRTCQHISSYRFST